MEKREGYKKTKIGWIPDDWDIKRIDEVAEVFLSNVDKKTIADEIEVSLCNYMDVFHNDYIKSSMEFMKATATIQEIEKFSLKKNDVLLTKDSETQNEIAESAVVSEEMSGLVCGYHLAILRPQHIKIAGNFLMNTIKSPAVHNHFVKLTNGVTRFGLNKASINEALIPLPPLPEQKKIASILTTVDDKISSIEQQIQQTEQLKKGLMEKLLTEGIGHTEFKDTKIGRIPRDWDVVKVKNLGDVITGSTPKTSNNEFYNNGSRLWASPADLGTNKYVKNTIKKLSPLGFEQIRRLPSNSLLVTCIGSTIGKIGVASEEMSTNQQINSIVCNSEHFHYDCYYYILLRLSATIKQLSATQAVPILNKTDFSNIAIPKIPHLEQKQIASILSTVDDKIEVLTQRKDQYQTLKKGLSQQLLTGQMRVKV